MHPPLRLPCFRGHSDAASIHFRQIWPRKHENPLETLSFRLDPNRHVPTASACFRGLTVKSASLSTNRESMAPAAVGVLPHSEGTLRRTRAIQAALPSPPSLSVACRNAGTLSCPSPVGNSDGTNRTLAVPMLADGYSRSPARATPLRRRSGSHTLRIF